MDLVVQIVLALSAMISNAATNRWGYVAVRKSLREEMANKVDVVIYSSKVSELHNEINKLRERIVRLETEAGNRD